MSGDPFLFDPFATLAEIRGRGAEAEGQKLPQKLPQAPAEVFRLSDHILKPTSAASATSAGCPDARDLAPAPVQKKGKNNHYLSVAYAEDDRPSVCMSVRASGHPAEVAEAAEAAEVSLSYCFQSEKPLDPAAEVLRKFRAGLAGLSPDRPPCPGYRLEEWPRVLARAHAFLDAYGPQAVALGWTDSRLFGVHPEAGIVRVDACGALVLPHCKPVRAITATSISFERLTHRMHPGHPEGIPLWEFGRNA